MRTLYIDVASHQGLIAAVSFDAVPASQPVDHRITDGDLLPLIERVVKDAQWMLQDIVQIACVVGPGGFTSLRVGVSAANALAWALGIPSCGIHLSDLYHERAAQACHPEPVEGRHAETNVSMVRRAHHDTFFWLHSTKKSEIFLRGFGRYQSIAPDATWMKLDDAIEKIPVGAPIVGELIPEHREALAGHDLTLAEMSPVSEILPAFLQAQIYREQILQPWYGRNW